MKSAPASITMTVLPVVMTAMPVAGIVPTGGKDAARPNILFAISDDQSFPFASAYGMKGVSTPAFDRVATAGILFNNAFVAAPQSSPSRAAILTGMNIWQLEEAGTHSSLFPKKFRVFTGLLEASGYEVGFTGKAWGPGNFEDAGWERNPVGKGYDDKKVSKVPATGISNNDYSGNFRDFYDQKPAGKPFFFWYGSTEPHRIYENGSGIRAGKQTDDAFVPSFLPDVPEIRSDILDYLLEIEYFDLHLMQMIDFLAGEGELENTIVIVTADNGMSFPSAKANLMEYGTHVPLAICWPAGIKGGRKSDDLVSLIDIAPTILEICGITGKQEMTGRSLSRILFSSRSGIIDPSRNFVLTGRERHSHARPDNLGYPARSIRTAEFLYIANMKPDRWPAGDPPGSNPALENGYHDIDDGPSKRFLIEKKDLYKEFFSMGYEKRPAEQLYNIVNDPGCTENLAELPEYRHVKANLKAKLYKELKVQKDPRVMGTGDIFDSYPRFGVMREFEGFRERGKYNPAFLNNNRQ